MKLAAVSLVLLSFAAPAAAEELVTSAFRVTLPPEWEWNKRGSQGSTLLEETRRPDCEFGGRTYEAGSAIMSIHWSANQVFDHDSPNWGPTTPAAAYAHALSEWTGKAKAGELTEVERKELPATLPVLRATTIRGMMPHLKRRATYVAVLRDDGIAIVEMLAREPLAEHQAVIEYLVKAISTPSAGQALPPCKFKGKGSPAMWSTWKNAPK